MKVNNRRGLQSNQKLPIWLERLSVLKTEIKGVQWPKAGESFRQGIALMAIGLEVVRGQRSKDVLTAFSKADFRWLKRWRRERARVFPSSA